MPYAASLSLQHLAKVFPGQTEETCAVKDFSLSVEAGEFLVLVGPSGCGKSTVLRMVAGLEQPTGGSVFIDGQDATLVAPKDRDFAMVFQTYALYPHLTARGNMEFGLKIAGLSRDKIEARVHEASEILGIEGILDRKPHQLSGGERQRVALGRAIVRKPRLFLFDEPFSNLDAQMRAQMRVQLGLIHSRLQATVIYVTHNQVEAMTMGSRVVCMNEGRLQQIGRPMELYDHPANEFVAGFIGTPPMNFVRAEVKDGMLSFLDADACIPLPAALENAKENGSISSSSILLGARPEHIVVGEKDASSFSATVEMQEFFGYETLLYLASRNLRLVVRVPASQHHEIGEPLFLRFQEERLHVFVDGQNITDAP